jgi:hypothetical protein
MAGLVPAIHAPPLLHSDAFGRGMAWITGTSPVMTRVGVALLLP